MRALLVGLLLASAVVVQAQQFCLKDNRGKQFGPFELKEGATVTVGRAQASISKVMPLREQVFERMRSIIIPRIDFKDTDVREAIAFLQKASVENDPLHRGVEMALDLTAVSNATPSEVGGTNAAAGGRITVTGSGISLRDALEVVARAGGLKYHIADGVVLVTPWNAPVGEIIRRSYRVTYGVVERVEILSKSTGMTERVESDTERPVRRDTQDYYPKEADYKRFFGMLGVNWPPGSSVEYVHSVGRIAVANTRENLDLFETILWDGDAIPYQVEIEMQLVAFDMTKLAALASSGISAASLIALWAQGHGQLIAAPRVVTQGGVEVTVKGVTEYLFPTEFDVYPANATNGSEATVGFVVEPGSFETREVGAILQVLPEVSEEGKTINLTLSPEFVEDPDWRDYGSKYVNADGHEQQVHMEQPLFHAYSMSTSIIVADGQRVLMGGGVPMRGGKKLIYTFVTARLIGLDGEPIRPRTEQARGGALEL